MMNAEEEEHRQEGTEIHQRSRRTECRRTFNSVLMVGTDGEREQEDAPLLLHLRPSKQAAAPTAGEQIKKNLHTQFN